MYVCINKYVYYWNALQDFRVTTVTLIPRTKKKREVLEQEVLHEFNFWQIYLCNALQLITWKNAPE